MTVHTKKSPGSALALPGLWMIRVVNGASIAAVVVCCEPTSSLPLCFSKCRSRSF
jgi:hypothetical protein